MLEAFAISTLVVAVAEIGDKTQLLAFVLAARYRQPWPVIAGILVATLLNHALAGAVGQLAAHLLQGEWLRYILAAGFAAMALWVLIPDAPAADDEKSSRFGPFLTTAFVFFVVEMGDKTQIATVALAARFDDAVTVVIGSTLGLMLANAPVAFMGNFAADRLPLRAIRIVAALLFAATAVFTLVA